MCTIIAYTYEADIHCIECTNKKFGEEKVNNDLYPPIDNEGNEIHPIFSTDDDTDELFCGTCSEKIEI